MEWKRENDQWVSGLFKIVKRFRFYVIYFNGRVLEQSHELKIAQQRAEQIKNEMESC